MTIDNISHHEERPWIDLKTTYDVETWIDHFNRDLQRSSVKTNASGYGICFCLTHGGEIFMHTTTDGEVMLDVTGEAAWVTPIITAVTHTEAPSSAIWFLPGDTLTQLLFGLSSLIASTKLVVQHEFKIKKTF